MEEQEEDLKGVERLAVWIFTSEYTPFYLYASSLSSWGGLCPSEGLGQTDGDSLGHGIV